LSKNARRPAHPYQLLDASDLSVGAKYAFVAAERHQPTECLVRVMAGEFGNTVGLTQSRGWDIVSRAIAGVKIPLAALLDDFHTFDANTGGVVTVHLDGWRGCETKASTPTLVYWLDGNLVSWDPLHTFLGPQPQESLYACCAVVPEKRWLADPRLYARVAWRGTDQSRAESAEFESPMDFERRMRAKLNKAMRERHGF